MYSFKSKIRYSELGRNGKLSMYSLMNYLQDCSTFQSDSLGRGIEYLKKKNRAWWLAAWNIEILRLPGFKEEIEISTWAYGFKGIYGYRNFAIKDMAGNYLVKADSTWFFFDTEKMRPAIPKDEDINPYMKNAGKRLDINETVRKLEVGYKGELRGKIKVINRFLDSNNHVNNARYVEFAVEYIPDYTIPKNIEVQYKKSARFGDKIFVYVNGIGKGTYTITMTDKDGNIYAIVKIIC